MRVAILPVYCAGTERQSTFNKAWLERVASETEAYFATQSGGRVTLTFKVFDWHQIAMTTKDWAAAGFLVGRKVYEAMVSDKLLSRDDFDHFVVLIDDATSSLGVTPKEVAPETSVIAAVGQRYPFTAGVIAHELGHAMNAVHTKRKTADGWKSTTARTASWDSKTPGTPSATPHSKSPPRARPASLPPSARACALRTLFTQAGPTHRSTLCSGKSFYDGHWRCQCPGKNSSVGSSVRAFNSQSEVPARRIPLNDKYDNPYLPPFFGLPTMRWDLRKSS
ncbi:hypothetical protein QTI24_30685 [Variovorax sp. J22P240]|uniref:hypothetical protein n=1 Tax=Variovorax sp. J22P240 TaxID=3053514 RepID=UPI002577210C|nr:hypothetical protein [Variovorax sp. J22P240]MDM0002987.1 hypothetical protein [Variovorax sp. J22P240]